MDPASLRPAVVHRHHSTRSPSPASSSSGPSNSLSSSRTSTRASTSSLVRPAPARKGQPASSRNFAASSAAGATSHLAHATQHAHARHDDSARTGLNEQQVNKLDHWEASYAPSEETIRNDYSGEYVATGRRPQNFIRNAQVESRFSEYPKLASLLAHKHALTSSSRYSMPPTYLNSQAPASSNGVDTSPLVANGGPKGALTELIESSARFDSILLTPPASLSFDSLASLPIASIASNPGFIWVWVGSGQKTFNERGEVVGTDGIGLEKGRELLAGWGYRRCEDIVWLKSNKKNPEGDLTRDPTSLFTPTVEHCLMGIRGTVRRSTDSWFVHCNVDTDVVVWEGDAEDPNLKPPELQTLIENFCLGTRRLHLFGSKNSLRRGWLTVSLLTDGGARTLFSKESKVQTIEKEDGIVWEPREWDKDEWAKTWEQDGEGSVAPLLPFNEELDALRPKSPPPRNGQPSSGGLGRGRGAGLGITRSGLVNQAMPRGPLAAQAAPSDNLNASIRGRVRGLGHGKGAASTTSNGFDPASSLSPSPSYTSLASSRSSHALGPTPTPPAASGSPYRIHSLTQPVPPSHPLPSRPSFVAPLASSVGPSAHSTHPSRYKTATNTAHLTPPRTASQGRPQPHHGGARGVPPHQSQHVQPGPQFPSPDQRMYAQQHLLQQQFHQQSQQQFQQHYQQHFQQQFQPQAYQSYGAALRPAPSNAGPLVFAGMAPPTTQFANMSFGDGPLHPNSFAVPPAPVGLQPGPVMGSNHFVPSPSVSPAISPAMSHMALPAHPHVGVPPASAHFYGQHSFPPGPPSLSSSSSASSSAMRFGYGSANGDELEYPIGGPRNGHGRSSFA